MTPQQILTDIETHSLVWLFFLAIFEGPIVSVGAGWLARVGNVSLPWAFAVLVLADLIGDVGLYSLGRAGLDKIPLRLRRLMHLSEDRVTRIAEHFQVKGGRTLVIGKLTHSLGFAVLVAAGVGRMSVFSFLWYNLLATLPKTAFFLLLGFLLGHAFASIQFWLVRVTVVLLGLGIMGVLAWFALKRE